MPEVAPELANVFGAPAVVPDPSVVLPCNVDDFAAPNTLNAEGPAGRWGTIAAGVLGVNSARVDGAVFKLEGAGRLVGFAWLRGLAVGASTRR